MDSGVGAATAHASAHMRGPDPLDYAANIIGFVFILWCAYNAPTLEEEEETSDT